MHTHAAACAKQWRCEHCAGAIIELAELFLSRGSGADGYLRSSAVKQYQRAVQRFLEHLPVLVHVGSGQPARRVEFLGLRWCNKQANMRNISLHDGYVIDECLLLVTASKYRGKMGRTKEFRNLGCQMIYLTTTLPMHMSMQFSERATFVRTGDDP